MPRTNASFLRFSATLAALVLGGGLLAATPIVSSAPDDEGRIIVGPVRPHGFQLTTADSGDVPANASEINLAGVLSALGPDATLWYQHVLTLSNPFFEGRGPGTDGDAHAAAYLEFWFKRYGLEPAFPGPDEEPGGAEAAAHDGAWTSYRQPFSVRMGRRGGGGGAGIWTQNLGGVLRGKGDLANEWIIIGGHYDHVGYGGRSVVHPGADDNASGTSGMLILAKRLSEHYAAADDGEHLRSVLFMGFGAEEMGLLGSRHYVQNPTLAAEDVSMMLNLDMIGRLRDNALMVGGVGTAEGFLDLLRPHLLASGLTIHADPTGRGPSDHQSFYNAGIPVIFAFTGVHGVYHQPGDHGYTVNPAGAIRVIDLCHAIVMDLLQRPEKLVFTRAEAAPAQQGRPGTGVTFGIMPAYDAELEKGILVDTVLDNSPAASAGLQKGDIIIGWDGEALDGGQALMDRIRAGRANQVVKITLLREGREMTIDVTLRSRGG